MSEAQPVQAAGDQRPHSIFGSAPRIVTERLILRAFNGSDYEPFKAMMAEPKVFEHLGGEPINDEEAMRRLSMYAGFWQIMGVGMWAAEDSATGELVGQVGIFDLHRELAPPISDTLEMGWIFATSTHGKGLAREACDAVLDWIQANIGACDLFAIIGIGNAASMKLAERLGFDRRDDAIYKDEPIAVFLRPA